MGAEQHVASMGDLKMREDAKLRQAKMKRDKRIETGMRYLGHGLGIAGKVNGVRAASPSKQSNLLLSAVSAGLNAGGSMMRDRTSNHHAAAQQPAGSFTPREIHWRLADSKASAQQLLLQQRQWQQRSPE